MQSYLHLYKRDFGRKRERERDDRLSADLSVMHATQIIRDPL